MPNGIMLRFFRFLHRVSEFIMNLFSMQISRGNSCRINSQVADPSQIIGRTICKTKAYITAPLSLNIPLKDSDSEKVCIGAICKLYSLALYVDICERSGWCTDAFLSTRVYANQNNCLKKLNLICWKCSMGEFSFNIKFYKE